MKDSPKDKEIIDALNAICIHPIFSRAPLLRAFLTYVVTEALAGRADKIKAYSIAVDALGKPFAFDAQRDPSVRVLAKRLRDSLDRYYEQESDYRLYIVLQPGSYVPGFAYTKKPQRRNLHSHTPGSMLKAPADTRRSSWSKPVVIYKS